MSSSRCLLVYLTLMALTLVDIVPHAASFSNGGLPTLARRPGVRTSGPFTASPAITRRRRGGEITRICTNSANNGKSYNTLEIIHFPTLTKLLQTTIPYTAKRILDWCNRPFNQVQQWTMLLVYYFFHLLVLSQHFILFPFQIIPNNKGHFCSLGWDSVAGIISLAIFLRVKTESTYFRTPWRKLKEHVESSTTGEKEKHLALKASSAHVEAEETAANSAAIVSQVMQQVPKQISLQRSKPPTESTILEPNVSFTTEKTEEEEPNNLTRSTTAESPPQSYVSRLPVTFVAQTYAISSSGKEALAGINETASGAVVDKQTPANETAVSPTVMINSTTDDKAMPATAVAIAPAPAPEFTLPFDSLSEQFKPLSDALQELSQKAITFLADTVNNANNANNNTRIDKQGMGDLSAALQALPPLGPRSITMGSSILATCLLVITYLGTGRFSFFWEDTFYAVAGVGFPLTIAMHRSLVVLLGHLTWVATGSIILGTIPRPQFFGRNTKWYRQGRVDDDREVQEGKTDATERRKKRSNTWIWWVIGGYSVSAWLFNMADFVNLYALPQQVLENAILEEGVVTQLINPENNDFLASAVGYIAPCLSAPWWEEVLYRGFLLPALSQFMPVWASVLVSGVVFSAHHLSIVAGLPLAVLGWTWAALYMASDNLWSTIAVHALWNSRVFLSSWLGL